LSLPSLHYGHYVLCRGTTGILPSCMSIYLLLKGNSGACCVHLLPQAGQEASPSPGAFRCWTVRRMAWNWTGCLGWAACAGWTKRPAILRSYALRILYLFLPRRRYIHRLFPLCDISTREQGLAAARWRGISRRCLLFAPAYRNAFSCDGTCSAVLSPLHSTPAYFLRATMAATCGAS